jgi:hypothetical protein
MSVATAKTRRGVVYRTSSSPRTGSATIASAVGFVVWGSLTSMTGARVCAYVGAAGMLVLGLRFRAMGVYVEQGGVRVLRLTGTTRVAWADVEGFKLGPVGQYKNVGLLVRKTGRTVVVFSIGAKNRFAPSPPDDATAVIATLNRLHGEWLDSQRAAHLPAP